jgi:outer membrane protein OmpA-like peptidoglycan-associated protein
MAKIRTTFTVKLFTVAFLFVPSILWGKVDYAKVAPDDPGVLQAAEEAAKKLGPAGGAIPIEKRTVDILGIPKGTEGAGVGISGRVADMEHALKDLGAQVTNTEIKIELSGDVLFDFNKYDIRPDAQEALDKVAVVIRGYPKSNVLIEGHTDSVGKDGYNLKLSMQRAESVKQWLQERKNLKEVNFQTKGWGEGKPIAANETAEGRQKNRRVEITIKK